MPLLSTLLIIQTLASYTTMECFPNADIATFDSVNNARLPIGLDEVGKWIEHLTEVFENGTDSEEHAEVVIRITGLPTPAATKLLQKFFNDKSAFYASADIIVFPESKSGVNCGVRCIRILGVGLDFNNEMHDEEGDESEESDEIDPWMSQDAYASFRPPRP
jgi:hypothetical protein